MGFENPDGTGGDYNGEDKGEFMARMFATDTQHLGIHVQIPKDALDEIDTLSDLDIDLHYLKHKAPISRIQCYEWFGNEDKAYSVGTLPACHGCPHLFEIAD